MDLLWWEGKFMHIFLPVFCFKRVVNTPVFPIDLFLP